MSNTPTDEDLVDSVIDEDDNEAAVDKIIEDSEPKAKPVELKRKVTWAVQSHGGATVALSATGLKGDGAGDHPDVADLWRTMGNTFLTMFENDGATEFEWADPSDQRWDD